MRPAARVAGLALAAAAVGCGGAAVGSDRLSVQGPAWIFAGRSATLTIATSGALAERDVSLVVAVDSDVVARVGTVDGRARVVVPAARLTVGEHEIAVKTGSERSVLRLLVVPATYPAAVAAAIVVLSLVVWRRRRAALSR